MRTKRKLSCPIEVRDGTVGHALLGYAQTESELRELLEDGPSDHYILTFREDCAERHGRVDIVQYLEGEWDPNDLNMEDREWSYVVRREPSCASIKSEETEIEYWTARKSSISTDWHPDNYALAVIYGAPGYICKACFFRDEEAIATAFSYFANTAPPEGIIWEKGGGWAQIAYGQHVQLKRCFENKGEQMDAGEP